MIMSKLLEAFKEYKETAQDLADGKYDDYSPYVKHGKHLLDLAPTIEQALNIIDKFQHTLKARIESNKSISKDVYIIDEIKLAKLNAENSLCNSLLELLEVV